MSKGIYIFYNNAKKHVGYVSMQQSVLIQDDPENTYISSLSAPSNIEVLL